MRSVYCRCKLCVKLRSRTIDIQLSSGRSPRYMKPNSVKNTSNGTTSDRLSYVIIEPRHEISKQCGMCNRQSLRSACAYAQSDQSLY